MRKRLTHIRCISSRHSKRFRRSTYIRRSTRIRLLTLLRRLTLLTLLTFLTFLTFLTSEPDIQDEGAEGEQRRNERGDDAHERPARRDGGMKECRDKENEEEAVDPADDPDGHRHVRRIFQRHGDPEEHEIGDTLGDADDAQPANGGLQHGEGPGGLIRPSALWGYR